MNNTLKIGAVGALLEGICFTAAVVVFVVVLPAVGLSGDNDIALPAKALPLTLALPIVFHTATSLNMLYSAGLLLTVPALYERARASQTNLAPIAAASGLVAAALLLASGGIRVFGMPILAHLYQQNQGTAGTAYVALNAVEEGVGNAAFVAFGAWASLSCWSALRAGRLARAVSYAGIAWGLVAIIASFFNTLAPVGLLLGIFWFVWLGFVLWRTIKSHANQFVLQ